MSLARSLQRAATAAHVWLFRKTGGRLGGAFGRAPILLLNTRGRRSGRRSTTPLVYLRDGADLVVVASAGGAPRDPGWCLNLRAEPRATVELAGGCRKVVAREADADEKERLWPIVVGVFRGFEDYRRRTTRDIPLILLRPTD